MVVACRAEELPPGGLAALRRRRYPQPPQHPPHRRGADVDAQAQQLALDPLVAPAWVLPRHLLNQHREMGIHRRPSAAVRPQGHKPAMLPAASPTPQANPQVGNLRSVLEPHRLLTEYLLHYNTARPRRGI